MMGAVVDRLGDGDAVLQAVDAGVLCGEQGADGIGLVHA